MLITPFFSSKGNEMFEKTKLYEEQNFCEECGQGFNSLLAFEKHKFKEFGKDNRCMTQEEMEDEGMYVNLNGYWVISLNSTFKGK